MPCPPFVVATEMTPIRASISYIARSREKKKSHTLGKVLEALVVRHIGG